MTENKPQRIALCISGQPRSFEEAYPYIQKYIIDQHPQVDVFLHTWYSADEAGKRFTHTSDTVREEGVNVTPEGVPERLEKLYNPKSMVVEPQEDFAGKIRKEYLRLRDKTNPFATFSMWTSIQRCNDQKIAYEKVHGFVYDVVIKCRYDVRLTTPLNNLAPTPPILHTSYVSPEEDTVADILFYASSAVMDIICTLPAELDIHFRTLGKWNNEMLLAQHCASHNIPGVQHPEWQSLTLIRGQRSLVDTVWYVIRRIRTKLGI